MMHTLECTPSTHSTDKVQKQDAATNIKGRRTSSEIVKYKRNKNDRGLYIATVNLYNQMSKSTECSFCSKTELTTSRNAEFADCNSETVARSSTFCL